MLKLFSALICVLPMFAYGLDVSAPSAIVIDATSGKVLWQKDADESRFPASTTKIMTALLLIEHCLPDDVITAPADVEKVKEASMHLKPGEKVTVRNMLYAMMLRSANDGCYAVAMHIAGSVEAFAKMMNDRAKQIGCTNTHFHNPNGLNDPQHTTTAHDLALIGREAMRYPIFREVVKTYKYKIDRSENVHDRIMVNHDKYLRKDPTADGIKTGYTVPAGHCFVGSSSRNGFRVITVVMKSPHWQNDHHALLDYAFQNFEAQSPMHAGEFAATIPVKGGVAPAVRAVLGDDTHFVEVKGTQANVTKTVISDPAITAPIKKGQHVGVLLVQDKGGFSQRLPLLASEDLPANSVLSLSRSGPRGSFEMMGAALCAGALLVRGRSRRFAKLYGRQRTG